MRSVLGRRWFSKSLRSNTSKIASIDEPTGSLLSRVSADPSWDKELAKYDQPEAVCKGNQSYKRFIPESAADWRRMHDKDAGDDEEAFFAKTGEVIRDTKLVKAKTSTGWTSIKTAGIDTLIDILHSASGALEDEVLEEVVFRVEYLAPTLSVKKIRLFLESFANSSSRSVDKDFGHEMMHALGNELLCRYYSISLLSCASISSSMAKLGLKHDGTLNVLALAWKQNFDEPHSDFAIIKDAEIVEMAKRMLKAYSDMEYLVPLVVDAVLGSLKERASILSFSDKFDVVKSLIRERSDAVEANRDWLIQSISSADLTLSSAQQLVEMITWSSHVDFGKDFKTIAKERIMVVDGKMQVVVKASHGPDSNGLRRTSETLVSVDPSWIDTFMQITT